MESQLPFVLSLFIQRDPTLHLGLRLLCLCVLSLPLGGNATWTGQCFALHPLRMLGQFSTHKACLVVMLVHQSAQQTGCLLREMSKSDSVDPPLEGALW